MARMRAAMLGGDLARAAAEIAAEVRGIGWLGYYGAGGDAVHESFSRLVGAIRQARLDGRPDAGFGH